MAQPAHVIAPQQDRSRRTLERLVDAAAELFAEQGAEATSVAQIVDRAHSSVGSFYARFKGKDDLVRHLEDRAREGIRDRWAATREDRDWSAVPLRELVEALVRTLVDTRVRTGTRLLPDGSTAGFGRPSPRVLAWEVEEVIRFLTPHRERIRHPDPELAIELGFRVVSAGALELLPEAAEAAGEIGDEAYELVIRELSRMYRSYLGGASEGPAETADPASDEIVDPFDVWG